MRPLKGGLMIKAIATLLSLAFCLNASALVIKGEESSDHFVIAERLNQDFYFLECKGSYQDYICDSFYEVPVTFSNNDIKMMASDKMVDAYLAVLADVGVVAAAVAFPFIAAKLEVAYFSGVLGLSSEGVGAISAYAGAGAGAVGAPTSMISFDALDPFVHRDLSLSLSAIINEVDFGELDDIDGKETELGLEVTVEDVRTSQIIKSIKKLLKDHIEDNRALPHKIIFGE